MPRGCDHFVRVVVDGRKFKVEFDSDGRPLRIKERKIYSHGVYEPSYWVAACHGQGRRPKRIIEAAYTKLKAEDRNADATP